MNDRRRRPLGNPAVAAVRGFLAARAPARALEPAAAPRDDLALVAGRIFAADLLGGLRGGPLFWGGLALVIGGLLVVGAQLLPKPPAA